jgi:hypothetical protein
LKVALGNDAFLDPFNVPFQSFIVKESVGEGQFVTERDQRALTQDVIVSVGLANAAQKSKDR